MNELTAKRVSIFHRNLKNAHTLFLAAFPKVERMPFAFLMFMSLLPDIHYRSYYDGKTFVGTAFYVEFKHIVYLVYLAVDDSLRSKGYGSMILTLIKEDYPDRDIVLMIEPPDDAAPNAEQRQKRYDFYTRNGILDTGIIGHRNELTMLIMSTQVPFQEKELIDFFKHYHMMPELIRK